jgi:hypothetical protein
LGSSPNERNPSSDETLGNGGKSSNAGNFSFGIEGSGGSESGIEAGGSP